MHYVDSKICITGNIFGPAQGANVIFRDRERHKAGFFVGLHIHQGDESFEVLEGKIRFTVNGVQKVCNPGAILFIPAGVEHGFLVLEDACLDVISQQKMGLIVKILAPDGTETFREVYLQDFPSSRVPPADKDYDTRQEVRHLYKTTQHLL